MTTLPSSLRNQLERVVTAARDAAEEGARAALEALAVHHHEPYGHMTLEERKLRKCLRAHARQLGDRLDQRMGLQHIDRLTGECAYEHWHRMLFARFLAENHLLMESELGVAVSIEECEELAKEQGIDRWTLASRYAQHMLPQIFRPDDSLLQVALATEHRLKLEELLDGLDPAVFTAADSLGWVYQFWQSKKKDEVNKSEKKIGADELPAVTQLFTEPYMVQFLIHNALGAWHAGKVLSSQSDLARNAASEGELRQAVALPGVSWDYLRFVREDDDRGPWRPAAGVFEGWPRSAAELKILDPCCGSGHFLVSLLHHLVPLRMAEECLSARDACDTVLRDNLFGLEIDERCTQIAAFALALAAWKYPEAGGYRSLPDLHIACSGLPVSVAKEEWKRLALDKHNLRIALDWMYDVFKDAPVLGSLINPAKSSAAHLVPWGELSAMLEQALNQEQNETDHEMGVVAQGLAKAAQLLAGQYHLVITNVPYLKRGNQDSGLRRFSASNFSESKACLSTVSIERCIGFAGREATIAVVCPQPWLFLTSYKTFRKRLLQEHAWRIVAPLGHSAFETISGHVVDVILLHLTTYDTYRLGSWVNANEARNAKEKAGLLRSGAIRSFNQENQVSNPECRVVFGELSRGSLLDDYANSIHGQGSFDDPSYVRTFWELPRLLDGWILQQTSSQSDAVDAGCTNIFLWQDGRGRLSQMMAEKEQEGYSSGKWKAGRSAWGRSGIAISGMGRLHVNRYQYGSFDTNVAVVYPHREIDYLPIWTYCRSSAFPENVRKIDRKPKVTPKTFGKVPFDVEYWRNIASKEYPNGLPKPYSDDPTQWIFHGHPVPSEHPIQVAVARLLGYRWPAELDTEMELSDEARAWVMRCEELLTLADEDGIACIPSVRGEEAAADRLRRLLSVAYGPDWSPAMERQLLDAAGTRAADLDDWLRNHFFEQHCKVFHHRPFIWHIWDGRKRDGFHALVNYHKLAEGNGKGRKLLETLTYSYLGEWITRQKDGVNQGVAGAEDRLVAALELEKRLKAIIEGEPPFDIFIRWKPIEKQPIGWEPDINDGVRLNIRPFMAPDLPTGEKGADLPGGKKGAGVLRWKPNIQWEKDRGKDVASSPWDHLFKGDRINSHHLNNAEKRAARTDADTKSQRSAQT